MLPINKIKGALLVALGVIWSWFIYNFDTLVMHRERVFDTKAIICFVIGIIMLINGVRIYRRR